MERIFNYKNSYQNLVKLNLMILKNRKLFSSMYGKNNHFEEWANKQTEL